MERVNGLGAVGAVQLSVLGGGGGVPGGVGAAGPLWAGLVGELLDAAATPL